MDLSFLDDIDFSCAAPGFVYGCGKYYDIGLSTTFRQPGAIGVSHCGRLHGYDLLVRFGFETSSLDPCNWVIDFGSIKPVREFLVELFDHNTLVAHDDPDMDLFDLNEKRGLMRLRKLPAVGCEAFARLVYEWTWRWLNANGYAHVRLIRVGIGEHEANLAWYGASTDNFYTQEAMEADEDYEPTFEGGLLYQLPVEDDINEIAECAGNPIEVTP